jgi:hypothetical protein
LLDSGKIEEAESAVAKLFGVDSADRLLSSRAWVAVRKDRKAAEARLSGVRAGVEAKEALLAQEIAQARAHFAPMAQARDKFAQGDIAGAVQAAFGMSVDDFTKAALRGKIQEQPEVARLRQQIEQMAARDAERERREQEVRNAAEAARAQEQYRAQLVENVAELGGKFVAVAKIPAFIEQVFAIQQKYWNPVTQMTKSAEAAAELAYAELYAKFQIPEESGENGAGVSGRSPTERGKSPVKRKMVSVRDGETQADVVPTDPQERFEHFKRLAIRGARSD